MPHQPSMHIHSAACSSQPVCSEKADLHIIHAVLVLQPPMSAIETHTNTVPWPTMRAHHRLCSTSGMVGHWQVVTFLVAYLLRGTWDHQWRCAAGRCSQSALASGGTPGEATQQITLCCLQVCRAAASLELTPVNRSGRNARAVCARHAALLRTAWLWRMADRLGGVPLSGTGIKQLRQPPKLLPGGSPVPMQRCCIPYLTCAMARPHKVLLSRVRPRSLQ